MLETIIGILLIVMGIFLVISVLMQSSKNHRISGSIAGGAETFFGKQKGKTLDAMFNKLTTVVTVIFVVLVLVLYCLQPSYEEMQEQIYNELIEQGYTVDENGNLIAPSEDNAEGGETEETPADENVETPAEENAETPADENAEAPADENAETDNTEVTDDNTTVEG